MPNDDDDCLRSRASIKKQGFIVHLSDICITREIMRVMKRVVHILAGSIIRIIQETLFFFSNKQISISGIHTEAFRNGVRTRSFEMGPAGPPES